MTETHKTLDRRKRRREMKMQTNEGLNKMRRESAQRKQTYRL